MTFFCPSRPLIGSPKTGGLAIRKSPTNGSRAQRANADALPSNRQQQVPERAFPRFLPLHISLRHQKARYYRRCNEPADNFVAAAGVSEAVSCDLAPNYPAQQTSFNILPCTHTPPFFGSPPKKKRYIKFSFCCFRLPAQLESPQRVG